MIRLLAAGLLGLAPGLAAGAAAPEPLQDRPRIIALSPHAAELVFAAGAGDQLVGAVAHSDHPAGASRLPRIGDSTRLDRERILTLQPDLAIAWSAGSREQDLEWLASRGIEVYRTRARGPEEVADDIEAVGQRAGTARAAREAAAAFRRRLQALRRQYADLEPLAAFYLLWDSPLMTVGGEALISRAMELCGLRNLYADVHSPNLSLTRESLLARRPEVVVIPEGVLDPGREHLWRKPAWPGGRPAEIRVEADLLHRPGPRILDGLEALCRARSALEPRTGVDEGGEGLSGARNAPPRGGSSVPRR